MEILKLSTLNLYLSTWVNELSYTRCPPLYWLCTFTEVKLKFLSIAPPPLSSQTWRDDAELLRHTQDWSAGPDRNSRQRLEVREELLRQDEVSELIYYEPINQYRIDNIASVIVSVCFIESCSALLNWKLLFSYLLMFLMIIIQTFDSVSSQQ